MDGWIFFVVSSLGQKAYLPVENSLLVAGRVDVKKGRDSAGPYLLGQLQERNLKIQKDLMWGELPEWLRKLSRTTSIPRGSMYGIYPYIYHKNQPNVGKYTILGSSGIEILN